MRVKSIIIALGLIITMISGIKLDYFSTTREVQNSNTIAVDENVIETKNIVCENEKSETELEQIQDTADIEIEQKNSLSREKVEIQEETSKTISSQTTSTTSNKTQKSTQETKPKENTVIETPKEETQVEKTLTPDDLEYWCIGGGKNHIAGDRENEHGYYSSWDEANQAFLEYTKDWSSVQYKIDTCSCGKYYFWAIR